MNRSVAMVVSVEEVEGLNKGSVHCSTTGCEETPHLDTTTNQVVCPCGAVIGRAEKHKDNEVLTLVKS